MNIFVAIIILIIIIVIVVENVSFKEKLIMDRFNTDMLNENVIEMYLVKRNLMDGALKIGSSHMSHWGVVLLTNAGNHFLLSTQFKHITELKYAKFEYPFIYPVGDKYPFRIASKYSCKNKNLTVKDYIRYITLRYWMKTYGYFHYNCQIAAIDILDHFAVEDPPKRISGIDLISQTIHEIIFLK